jgi:FHA domain
MRLKLVLEQTNQSWTLNPTREYIIGSGSDCDIALPYVSVVASRHLKLSFNQLTNIWHAQDLGSANGTFVDNQPISDYPIRSDTKIAIAGGIFLLAAPEGLTPATPPPVQPQYGNYKTQSYYSVQRSAPTNKFGSLEVLTWGEYVERQMDKAPDWFGRITTRFALATGFRNTPWIRASGQTGFNAFDGYVIPDFKEPADKVALAIAEKLGKLKQYENTDCWISELTDAHIVDSETQKFSGIELFPIHRGGKADYRKFCVVSYHRVRTYLLVENYGSDLFVSWVTRFEPNPTSIWARLTFVISLISLSPLIIWSLLYIAVPVLMLKNNILPKKANAKFTIFLVFLIPIIVGVILAHVFGLAN